MDPQFAHPSWIAAGLVLMVVGIWMIRWASRNNMSSALAGAAKDAALNTIRKGGKLEGPGGMDARLEDISSAPGAAGKARKVAGYAARHAMSQLFGAGGFILALAGLIAALLGTFYR